MILRAPVFVAFSLLVLSSNAFGRGGYRDIWQNSESTIQSFKSVSKCTERIWPGLSWKGYTFLSVKNSKDRQVAFDVDTQETFRVSLKDLENNKGAYQAYDFFTSNGKKWVSVNESFVNQGGGPQALFELGAHESFHHIGQEGWASKEGSKGRGTDFPIRWEPRYYRAKLYTNLRQAFLNPEKSDLALGKAAFWFRKWKEEFREEFDSVTDGYEGTARYADQIAKGLAIKGCGVSEAQLSAHVRSNVRSGRGFNDVVSTGGFGAADFEGYPIGAVAAFILRWQSSINGWEKRVSLRAETPVEILLEKTVPIKDEILEQETVIFRVLAGTQQKTIETRLGDTLKKLRGDYTVVSIPYSYKPGATSYEGFYNDTGSGRSFGVLPETLMLQGQAGFFRTAEYSVTLFGRSQVCKEWGWNFVVAANEIKITGEVGYVQSLKIFGQAKGSMKTATDNEKHFCVGE